jgi:hypothetical protein
MKHIVNDLKVLQNISHTCTVALSIAPHCNLGPTLVRHQIPQYLLQTNWNYCPILFTWLSWGQGDGSICIHGTHNPNAALKATRASTPFRRVSGRVVDLSASGKSVAMCKGEMMRRGRIQGTLPLEILVSPHARALTCCVLPHVLLFSLCTSCLLITTSVLLCLPLICWKRGSACDVEPYKAVKAHLR